MLASVPGLHPPSPSKAAGAAEVFLQSRSAGNSPTGTFNIRLDVHFDPAVDDYATGSLVIRADLTDSTLATFVATSFDSVNSFGKHTPTIVLVGRCRVDLAGEGHAPKGCKFWVLIANNKQASVHGTPDVVGFVITDNTGQRIAYGTGPAKSGDIQVSPA